MASADVQTSPGVATLSWMAKKLGVPRTWLREQVEAGIVPALRAGKDALLFNPDAVERALAQPAAEQKASPTVTMDQLAEMLQVSRRTLERMKDAGQLPPTLNFPRAVRWSRATIEEWLRPLQGGD